MATSTVPPSIAAVWNARPGSTCATVVKPSFWAATAASMVTTHITPLMRSSAPIAFNTIFISSSYFTACMNIHSASTAVVPWKA